MPKRRKTEETEGDIQELTPRKTRKTTDKHSPATTPSNRKSILRGTPSKANGTPNSLRRVLFSTPAEKADILVEEEDEITPTATRNDRSARRKSVRTLQHQPADDESEDGDEVGETALARAILDDEEEDVEVEEDDQEIVVTTTLTKRGRGRPKGRPRKERTPSPPPNLPPHELYFFQNRTAGNQTSANTLPSNLLLNHDDYLTNITAYKDPHEADMDRLQDLHERAFDQWTFELEESFNLCLYGYGSKRELVMGFADHLHQSSRKPPKIVIINGYTPGLTLRDVLTTLASTLLPKSTKLPLQPPALVDLVTTHLTSHPPTHSIYLLIHSLDAQPLRRHQPTIARLASHSSISLIATVDTPHFPLLWDTSLLRYFNFLYHDTTTFRPFRVEIDVVEEVNTLLGRQGRRVGGKDGVLFVLRSLTENARQLYRLLLVEQVRAMGEAAHVNIVGVDGHDDDDESILGASDDEAALANDTPSRRREKRGRPPKKAKQPVKHHHHRSAPTVSASDTGIEYRALYHRAVEEFVCSSELSFRTLLKEFHDHAMVESRKDGVGVERIGAVGMAREEMEGVLEEIG